MHFGINQWIKNNEGHTYLHVILQKYKSTEILYLNGDNRYRNDYDMYKLIAETLLNHSETQICEWRPWNHCNNPPPYRKVIVCLCLLAKIIYE